MLTSNQLIMAIEKRLGRRRLFYVCRDIERAAGLRAKNYFIITNHNGYAQKLARQDSNIIIIKEKNQLNTVELLQHWRAKQAVRKNDFVLVFKNSSQIENICQKNGWRLLNPSAKLADQVESKISQIEWLGSLAEFLPKHRIDICQNIKWNGEPFILQYNHAHTGGGTLFINNKTKLKNLAAKFPRREVRISRYINGPVFTNNNAVWGNKILMGNINYQITGLAPFTDNKFATIGNDWALPIKLLSNKQVKQYKQIIAEIGKKLKKDGWKGLYGVDIILDEKIKRLYLLEINARQPASTTFESQLQRLVIPTNQLSSRASRSDEGSTQIKKDLFSFIGIDPSSAKASLGMTELTTTFEAHLASLLNIPNKGYKLISINDGAQIIQRVTKKNNKLKFSKIKNVAIVNAITYKNTNIGSDLIRIQCNQSIMQTPNSFNKLGKEIKAAIEKIC